MRRFPVFPALLLAVALPVIAQTATPSPRAEIEAFNRRFEDATRQMDNAATVALWADDGISLLPSTDPIVGKSAISAFLDKVTSDIKGAKMQKFELECFAIEASGDLASEWCNEHQIVLMPGGKPPFDGRGKMLLVLRKGRDGKWLLLREMWNQAKAD
ncbi:YybH family protein [Acidicapsa acidisoli]|uniref:YybH family protein n=1 Tax=Acidicapsa acidisoli TaxID=1615681 RepID=UPI0021DF84A4|nr:nuclear transport factor 2 family protein [Acidicapsa acidisoli]